jgi:hypothetical protein
MYTRPREHDFLRTPIPWPITLEVTFLEEDEGTAAWEEAVRKICRKHLRPGKPEPAEKLSEHGLFDFYSEDLARIVREVMREG